MTDYITSVGVQHYSITIASGSLTGTATINAVGSGAFIIHGGINPSVANHPGEDYAWVTQTNSTTITATRNTSTAGTIVVTGCIIDGNTTNLIASVQYGQVTIANTAASGTATVTAVTDANSAIHLLGWSSANTSYSGVNENPSLTQSGTTVTATRQGTVGALTVGFVLIAFQSGALNQSVQRISATSSLNTATWTAAVTSVVTNNTLCLYAGSRIAVATTNVSTIKMHGKLTSSTVFTATVSAGLAQAKTYNASVIEFIAGVFNQAAQRNTTALAGVTSNTATITGVVKNNSVISWLGNISNAGGAVADQDEGNAVLTNSTTVTITKATVTSTLTGSWEVAEFIPIVTTVIGPGPQGISNQFTHFQDGTIDVGMHKIDDGISADNDNELIRMAA